MKTIYKSLLAGMCVMVFSGQVLAHNPGYYDGYGGNGWSGNATVWGNSYGQSGWTGSLNYGVGYGYAPAPVPWIGHLHSPRCSHGPVRGYERGYRRGYHHGSHHGKKHHKRPHGHH